MHMASSESTTAFPSAASIAQRTSLLHAAASNRILVLDGAMGTMIQQHRLTEEDFRVSASPSIPIRSKETTTCYPLRSPM